MITKTHIDTIRTRMRENRVLINKSIDRSEEEANHLIFEFGCIFLEHIYGHSAAYVKHSRSKQFWGWYQLQWYGVEENFVHHMKRHSSRTPKSIQRSQCTDYMLFFCCQATRMEEAFKNYLKSI